MHTPFGIRTSYLRPGALRSLLLAATVVSIAGCSKSPVPANRSSPASTPDAPAERNASPETPWRNTPLELIVERIDDERQQRFRDDPSADGWSTEVVSEQVSEVLNQFGEWMFAESSLEEKEVARVVSRDCRVADFRPANRQEVFEDGIFTVFEAKLEEGLPGAEKRGPRALIEQIMVFRQEMNGAQEKRNKFKVVRVDQNEQGWRTRCLVELAAVCPDGLIQRNATWDCDWVQGSTGNTLKLHEISVVAHQEVEAKERGHALFQECTPSMFLDKDLYRDQIGRGARFWAKQIETRMGSDLMGQHGLAVADMNDDGLDDLYVCQAGGLPNLMLLQQPDGTVRNVAEEWGLDFLDASRSALLLDLDDDGDQDIVVATVTGVLILANEGEHRFRVRKWVREAPKAYSMCAADYDNDGDLDLYICLYHPPSGEAVANPLPYHDANNGSPNTLLRNDGEMKFSNATSEVGLDQNNTRWSYAAAWEDYDNDGDMDLYVANDFGRNCLYQNNAGKFSDVAPGSGVEDIASGMSVSWGDYNHDGWMDIYVSNMFSAAGGRITFQREFNVDAPEDTKRKLQRLARGNTLFKNQGDGTFLDVTLQAGVDLGRWAWSAPFVDWNNDGWVDLLIANGNITGEDTGDL